MSPQDKAGYEKLLAELKAIEMRLTHISDCSFEDMEGADAAEFHISETLWTELCNAAIAIRRAVTRVEKILKE